MIHASSVEPRAKAIKIIIYTSEGEKLIYKFGDPKGHKSLDVEMDFDVDMDFGEAVMDGVSAKQFITDQRRTTNLRIRQ